MLVTRDSGFAPRRVVRHGLMRMVQVWDDDLDGQLEQLVHELRLDTRREFTRCVTCNQPLIHASREHVADRVPPYVFQHQRNFMECPECKRVYWKGTHWARMTERLKHVFREARGHANE